VFHLYTLYFTHIFELALHQERLHFMPVDVQLPFALTRIGPIIPEKSDKGETPGKIPKASVARYLDKLILNHHFEPTEEEGGIDWDDLRIRTADKNERTSNLSWLNYSIVSPVAKAATKVRRILLLVHDRRALTR
jgi:hypothetical protein